MFYIQFHQPCTQQKSILSGIRILTTGYLLNLVFGFVVSFPFLCVYVYFSGILGETALDNYADVILNWNDVEFLSAELENYSYPALFQVTEEQQWEAQSGLSTALIYVMWEEREATLQFGIV